MADIFGWLGLTAGTGSWDWQLGLWQLTIVTSVGLAAVTGWVNEQVGMVASLKAGIGR